PAPLKRRNGTRDVVTLRGSRSLGSRQGIREKRRGEAPRLWRTTRRASRRREGRRRALRLTEIPVVVAAVPDPDAGRVAEAGLRGAAAEAFARGGADRTRPRCRRRHGLEGPGCVLGDGATEEHAVRGRAGGESNPEASLRGLVEREVDARAVAGRAQ